MAETPLPTSKHFRLEKLAEGGTQRWPLMAVVRYVMQALLIWAIGVLVFDTLWTPQASQDLRTAVEQLTGHAVAYIVNSP